MSGVAHPVDDGEVADSQVVNMSSLEEGCGTNHVRGRGART